MSRMANPPVTSPYRVRARNLAPDSDNKIHDDDVARQFGFSGALVPGVEVFAYAVHPFVDAWGPDLFAGGKLAIRFRRPVYDGELVEVSTQPADDGCLALHVTGPDGEMRAAGTAAAPSASRREPVDVSRFPTAAVPADPPVADEKSLAVGTVLGTVVEVATAAACTEYLAGINETSTLYADEGIVHPGALLRMVNASLLRNVALGPWIHTESDCLFVAPACVGATLSVRAVVTDLWSHKANDYVRYDALVLADDAPAIVVRHAAIYRLGPG
jgi:acyl dehydratase